MKHAENVVISGIHNVNALGVLRGLSRKGIPVIVLDVDRHSMVRHSRHVSRLVPCPNPADNETGFIETLLKLGRTMDHRPVYIPTGDAEVMALSKHKDDLLSHFRMPVAPFDTISLLVNKKLFFQDVIRRSIPCPRTAFPESVSDMRQMASDMGYPLIVKSAYSHRFIQEFHKKVFVIHSKVELETVIEWIGTEYSNYFLQEIIPGNALYLFYGYFNRQSVPVGLCGYDKVRQFPKDFGIGTICRSNNRPQPIQDAIRYLQAIGYYGLAEPEFKLDPRDNTYKLIEINTRSVTQTQLAAACGAHVEYLAYMDLIEGNVEPVSAAMDGVLWIDEINELHYQLSRIRRGFFNPDELIALAGKKKVFAASAIDDPIPIILGLIRFFHQRLTSPRSVDAMLNL